MGPSIHLLSLMGGGEAEFARMESEYRTQAEALVRGGVDVLHLERCMDLKNLRAAMTAIASLGTTTPCLISADIEMMGTMLDGTTPEAFVERAGLWGEVCGHFRPHAGGAYRAGFARSLPDAHTFQPGCEQDWWQTPRADFVKALQKQNRG
jgi:5-methyltetrahydrofolate--homocysteine methyltransferase